MRRNNIERARKIARALRKWHGDKFASEREIIADALADLMHLCDLRGLEFHDVEQQAIWNYAAELKGEDDPTFKPEPQKLTDEEEASRAAILCEMLQLKRSKEHKDRFLTGWGTKTALGVFRSAQRIIEKGE